VRRRHGRCLVLVSLASAFLWQSGCSDGGASSAADAGAGSDAGSAVANPSGTVTTELMAEGNGPDSVNFEEGSVFVATLNGGMVLCESRVSDLSLDDALNFQACGGSIAYLGAVSGLGDITSAPASGFVASAAALIGGGFVVKTVGNNLYRVYVAREVLSVSGGVLGVEINWAALGATCAANLTQCSDGACVNTLNDPNNCGGCGIVCPGAIDGGAGCVEGVGAMAGEPVCTAPNKTR
jgi:hypothetical protein